MNNLLAALLLSNVRQPTVLNAQQQSGEQPHKLTFLTRMRLQNKFIK